jgi:hypothetical protein
MFIGYSLVDLLSGSFIMLSNLLIRCFWGLSVNRSKAAPLSRQEATYFQRSTVSGSFAVGRQELDQPMNGIRRDREQHVAAFQPSASGDRHSTIERQPAPDGKVNAVTRLDNPFI